MKTVQSYLRGSMHEKRRMPCQDKIKTYSDGNIAAMALSDGASGARLSEFGAEACVESAVELITERFDALYDSVKAGDYSQFVSDLYNAINAAQNKIMPKLKGEFGKKLYEDDFYCTLLFFAARANKYILGHIGDGAAIAFDAKTGIPALLSAPSNGMYKCYTFFANSEDIFTHLSISAGDCSNIDALILTSDGAQDLLIDKDFALAKELYERLMTSPHDSTVEGFLLDRVYSAQSDDSSIAVLLLDSFGV